MYHVIKQYARSLALVLFLGVGLVFTSTPAAGQVDISPGVRVGLNAATVGGDAADMGALFTSLATNSVPNGGTVSSRDGFMIGVFAAVDFGAPVVVQPGLRFNQKGYSVEYGSFFSVPITTQIKLSYIEIPILAKYTIPAKIAGFKPHLFAGPTLGFNVGATSEYGAEGTFGLAQNSVDLKSISSLNGDAAIGGTDFGLEFGVGASYTVRGLGTATADLRYGLGLANILNTDAFASGSNASNYSLTNQVLSVTVGFTL